MEDKLSTIIKSLETIKGFLSKTVLQEEFTAEGIRFVADHFTDVKYLPPNSTEYFNRFRQIIPIDKRDAMKDVSLYVSIFIRRTYLQLQTNTSIFQQLADPLRRERSKRSSSLKYYWNKITYWSEWKEEDKTFVSSTLLEKPVVFIRTDTWMHFVSQVFGQEPSASDIAFAILVVSSPSTKQQPAL